MPNRFPEWVNTPVVVKAIKMRENLNQNSRSLKWEPNGELAQKDLSELIERLKNVEGDDTSSELSRLGTKSNTIN